MNPEEGRAGSVLNSEGDNPLLTPYKLGPFQLTHRCSAIGKIVLIFVIPTVERFQQCHPLRIVYAPLTRMRAFGGLPQPHITLYYSQRDSPGGFMICEGTCIDETAYGNPDVPGIHSKEQVEAWKPVVQAVHDKGAFIFCQLWHVGRASHNEFQPNKATPVSSTSVPIRGSQIRLPDFSMAYSGHFIAAGGFTKQSGNQAMSSGKADLIAFGRMFISNPDLPRRFELNAPLTKYNRDTFYIPDSVLGYTDYPFFADV